ncbi:MAG: hypothetical protein ACFFCS_24915 [Candidatus Hodarchaeota archaeon]
MLERKNEKTLRVTIEWDDDEEKHRPVDLLENDILSDLRDLHDLRDLSHGEMRFLGIDESEQAFTFLKDSDMDLDDEESGIDELKLWNDLLNDTWTAPSDWVEHLVLSGEMLLHRAFKLHVLSGVKAFHRRN